MVVSSFVSEDNFFKYSKKAVLLLLAWRGTLINSVTVTCGYGTDETYGAVVSVIV